MDINQGYNILILNHHAGVPEFGGGNRHFELAKYLAETGHDVTVIASSYDNGKKRYHFNEPFVIKKYNDNFRFVWLRTVPAYKGSFFRFINYFDYMVKAIRFNNFKIKPNIVIASSVHPLAWAAGYRLSKRFKAKFIVEVRDLWPLSLYEDYKGFSRKLVFYLFEALEKKYYNLADSIVTTMPYAAEYMEEKYGIPRKKVNFIPHGIDIDQFDQNLVSGEKALDSLLKEYLDNYFCVTYAGALSKSEGLSTLLDAALQLRQYRDIRFLIVGSGVEGENMAEIIDQNKLFNVMMIKKQSKDLVPIILSKSAVLFCGLIDRKVFNYGISKNKFYDYMAARRPIIFASSVRESLIDIANAGISIKPGDSLKLAESILTLYNNANTSGLSYGQNGRNYVERNHTIQKVANDFIHVISEI